LEAAIAQWMSDDNHRRIHQNLGYTTPWENYRPGNALATAA
jgi:transposase InsO family protein